jgi:hypothetical protein
MTPSRVRAMRVRSLSSVKPCAVVAESKRSAMRHQPRRTPRFRQHRSHRDVRTHAPQLDCAVRIRPALEPNADRISWRCVASDGVGRDRAPLSRAVPRRLERRLRRDARRRSVFDCPAARRPIRAHGKSGKHSTNTQRADRTRDGDRHETMLMVIWTSPEDWTSVSLVRWTWWQARPTAA